MTNPIKDSGSRTLYSTGANRDCKEKNGRTDLMPLSVVADLIDYAPQTLYVEEQKRLSERRRDDFGRCINAFIYHADKSEIIRAMYEFIIRHEIFLKEYKETASELGCEVDVNALTAKQLVTASMLPLSMHFKNGTLKYGERNWEKGISMNSYIDSAGRHYFKINSNFMDEPHHLAVLWNLMCLLWTHDNLPAMNNLPCKKEIEKAE